MSRRQNASAVTGGREERCYDKGFDGADEASLMLKSGSVGFEGLQRESAGWGEFDRQR